MWIKIDFLTAKKDGEDRYVDDNLSGGTEEKVNEMIGETRVVEGKYSYTGFVSGYSSWWASFPR